MPPTLVPFVQRRSCKTLILIHISHTPAMTMTNDNIVPPDEATASTSADSTTDTRAKPTVESPILSQKDIYRDHSVRHAQQKEGSFKSSSTGRGSSIILRRFSTVSPSKRSRRFSVASLLSLKKLEEAVGANIFEEGEPISNNRERVVNFTTVTIREFEIQPSDNASSITGDPCLELGWNYNILLSSFSIDAFEDQRTKQRLDEYHRRPLPNDKRTLLLQEFGYSKDEIEVASSKARKLRAERKRSVGRDANGLDGLDLVIENLGDLKKKLGCRG